MFCTKCGKEVRQGLKFCTQCGTPMEEVCDSADTKTFDIKGQQDKAQQKSKTKAGMVAILIISAILIFIVLAVAFWILCGRKLIAGLIANNETAVVSELEEKGKAMDDNETDNADETTEVLRENKPGAAICVILNGRLGRYEMSFLQSGNKR